MNSRSLLESILNNDSRKIETLFEELMTSKVEAFMAERRVAVVNELSTKTLIDYAKKADANKSEHLKASKEAKKLADTRDNDEDWKTPTKDAIAHDNKARSRMKNITRALLKVQEARALDELSTDLLAAYKTKAGADARANDAKMNFKKADKRFSGIIKATKKQFTNDAKIHEHIVQTDTGFRLVSKKTGKNLGDFSTREEAEKHEREVEYFKSQNK